MGAAAFSSTYVGYEPVPKHKLTHALSRRACVVMVDEYLTSQMCSQCAKETKSMSRKQPCPWTRPSEYVFSESDHNWIKRDPSEYQQELDEWRQILMKIPVRGIKQCKTTGCRITHDRDRNAAKNILVVFKHVIQSGKRPAAFERKTVQQMPTQYIYFLSG